MANLAVNFTNIRVTAYHEKVQLPIQWETPQRTFTVTTLTNAMRDALSADFSDVWVGGEISGVKAATSGHVYFTLKDANAQIRCALFARTARFIRFKPRDGVEVLVRGRIDIYSPRGEYQLLVDAIEPRGVGALQIAFEQLKQKLAQEGLFDAARKRPLPPYPKRIGIITSPAGAVIRDMLNILTRRFPGLHIRLYPAQVQGDGAIEQICRGLEYFRNSSWPEVVILARGGGSAEDLWTFNEEAVARGIVASPVPVISAIGHETDFTIADFVADLRAPTPSAAAELVVGTREQVIERIASTEARLLQLLRYRIALSQRRLHQLSVDRAGGTLHRIIGKHQQRVDELSGSMTAVLRAQLAAQNKRLGDLDTRVKKMDLRLRLAHAKRRLEAASVKLEDRIRWTLGRAHRRFEPLDAHLTQLSPLRVLERGYAIVQDSNGAVLKTSSEAAKDDVLRVRLASGELSVVVKEIKSAQ